MTFSKKTVLSFVVLVAFFSTLSISGIVSASAKSSFNGKATRVLSFGDFQKNALWSNPSVLKEGKSYVMYASANIGGKFDTVLPFRGVSKDGLKWTMAKKPLLQPGKKGGFDADSIESPSVVKFKGKYHMFYTGVVKGAKQKHLAVGHAVSKDGINWKKVSSKALLKPTGNAGRDWNGYHVAEPGAVVFKNKIYLYFHASGGRKNPKGPRNQSVIGLVTSSDGVKFSAMKQVLSQGPLYPTTAPEAFVGYSTPSAEVVNGKLHLFYDVIGSKPGWEQVAIHHAVSSDGVKFKEDKKSIIRKNDLNWTKTEIKAPATLYENGKFRLWFSGHNIKNLPKSGIGHISISEPTAKNLKSSQSTKTVKTAPATPKVKSGAAKTSAKSSGKGGRFGKVSRVLSFGEFKTNALWNDPSVIKTDKGYVMYATANIGGKFGTVLPFRGTSKDGINWKMEDKPLLQLGKKGSFDQDSVETPTVVKFKGKYHMFYSGVVKRPTKQHLSIGHAISNDGVKWKRVSTKALLEPTGKPTRDWNGYHVAEPGAVVFNNKIYLYFHASGRRESGPGPGNQSVIGLVTSSDGINFTKMERVLIQGPLYPTSAPEVFVGYSTPSAEVVNGKVHLFYDVVATKPSWEQIALHHAVSSDGKHFKEDVKPILRRSDLNWSKTEVRAPTAMYEQGRFRIWFAGHDIKKLPEAGIGHLEFNAP